jgi:hypothetical protein
MNEVAGGLGRLIETEARLAEALAAAEAEAGRLLQAAREGAAAEEARGRQALEDDSAALSRRVAAERDAELSRVAAQGDQRSRRLRELPVSVVEELAIEVVGRVLADLDARALP